MGRSLLVGIGMMGSDAIGAVQAVSMETEIPFSPISNIVVDCESLIRNLQECQFRYILKEKNHLAHNVVRLAQDEPLNHALPTWLWAVLDSDFALCNGLRTFGAPFT
uniref:RNase H type-1 domain-containing protein n=1 Tax=Nelumbo nucifera TaxID=4432 RepID=A0A822YY52_NELNU|nr:TPA_asm: hypothetical protein HUJ06_006755 [Nelumbo nucifera]